MPAKTLAWESLSISPASSSSVSVLGSAQFPNPTKLPFSGTGFLGPTSWSGAFDDNAELLPVDHSVTKSTPIDPQQVARGAQVLFLLENLPLYVEVIEKRFAIASGWVLGPPLMREVFKVLGNVYRNATQDATTKYARLMDLSREFFRNTLTPMETYASMGLSDYFALASPRWEVISLLFAFVGTSTYQVPPHSLGLEQTDDATSKEGLRQICIQASETCLQFCNHLGTLSDPLAWAMIQHTVFLSCMHGSSGMS